MEHLRLNGAYWGLTTLDILGKLDAVDQDEVVSWVMHWQHESGGFGGNIGHDPHMLYTLSAIQVLALFDKIEVLDIEKPSLHTEVSYYASGVYMIWHANDRMKKYTRSKIAFIENRFVEALDDFGESRSTAPIPVLISAEQRSSGGGGGGVALIAGVVPGTNIPLGATDPPAVLEN
ncbi:unnamed protein product [Fraxinus pennsylvanica]|uniref:Geranylgeranyl transferase type II subunit beta n=1 Tax=Fraxinus pennsylvanica TaxID=56036 RepID=A0AAD2E291_9LAMI|nr:unnamed protein product [Fraxinus pennsylvanica]